MRRLSCIIWVGPKHNHKCPFRTESERELTAEEKGNVTTKAGCQATAFEDRGRGQEPRNAVLEAQKKYLELPQ